MSKHKGIKFHSLEEDVQLPMRSKRYTSAYDFIASDSLLVEAKGTLEFKTGLNVNIPAEKKFAAFVSNEFSDKGIMVSASEKDDEITCMFVNRSDEKVFIEEGQCYMHGIFVNLSKENTNG